MYRYTDPKVDIGVGLEDEPFDIEKLEDHFKEHTKVTEVYHQMERIPLMERTTPTTEVMPLREFKNNVGKFFKLCRMYEETSCELSRQSLGSEEETTKAFDALQPYICRREKGGPNFSGSPPREGGKAPEAPVTKAPQHITFGRA